MIALPSRDAWLDTAYRIGVRLTRDAEWADDRCSWYVAVPERIPRVHRARHTAAGPWLYQGTAGIGLFLAELFSHSRDERLRQTALGAFRHAIADAQELRFSFHSGTVGLIYALNRAASLLADSDTRVACDRLVDSLKRHDPPDRAGDVITGAAGAIPALLAIDGTAYGDILRTAAVALGETVLNSAHRRVSGWSWQSPTLAGQDLTGYAHGASGFGHALFELYAATGDEWYAYGAKRAYEYEDSLFDASARNWPDFRWQDISEYITYGAVAELRQRLLEGMPVRDDAYAHMIAWCHGAPGIGLARLRAYEITGEKSYRETAQSAAETTLTCVGLEGMGYSLCHGHFGNCELLLRAARLLERPDFARAVYMRADIGRRQELSGAMWVTGALGGVPDPSLLLGEAGIGYFYLRLYDERTPSILCLASDRRSECGAQSARRAADLHAIELETHFGATLRALEMFARDEAVPGTARLRDVSSVPDLYHLIDGVIESDRDERTRDILRDAFAVERARFLAATTYTYRVSDYVGALTRPEFDGINWEDSVFRSAPTVRLVQVEHDWIGFQTNGGEPPAETHRVVLVSQSYGNITTRVLSPLPALVLTSCQTGATGSEILRIVAAANSECDESVRDLVRMQIKEAYVAGLLTCDHITLVTI